MPPPMIDVTNPGMDAERSVVKHHNHHTAAITRLSTANIKNNNYIY